MKTTSEYPFFFLKQEPPVLLKKDRYIEGKLHFSGIGNEKADVMFVAASPLIEKASPLIDMSSHRLAFESLWRKSRQTLGLYIQAPSAGSLGSSQTRYLTGSNRRPVAAACYLCLLLLRLPAASSSCC